MVNLLKLCLAGLRGEETEAAMVNYLIPTDLISKPVSVMAVRVVEFSNWVHKIRKIFA